ncbi:hypothetical protein BHU16_01785 [Tannerella sp. oral taxon 808]|nr:hypothetical protein BHU16_01785 [Tannerella sp. oral taxon 808]
MHRIPLFVYNAPLAIEHSNSLPVDKDAISAGVMVGEQIGLTPYLILVLPLLILENGRLLVRARKERHAACVEQEGGYKKVSIHKNILF